MQYPTEILKIVKKYGCRRNDNPTTTHEAGVSSNTNPRTGLVVNLGTTATNREGITIDELYYINEICEIDINGACKQFRLLSLLNSFSISR